MPAREPIEYIDADYIVTDAATYSGRIDIDLGQLRDGVQYMVRLTRWVYPDGRVMLDNTQFLIPLRKPLS